MLLDTQALLWWLSDDSRLGAQARRVMMAQSLSVSVATLWEIAIKVGIGRLAADIGEVARAIDAQGIARLPIRDAHLVAYQALPRLDGHGDPFDRMLVSQARTEAMPILTADPKFTLYGVSTLDATR